VKNFALERIIDEFKENLLPELRNVREGEEESFLYRFGRQFRPKGVGDDEWKYSLFLKYHDQRKASGSSQEALLESLGEVCREFLEENPAMHNFLEASMKDEQNVHQNVITTGDSLRLLEKECQTQKWDEEQVYDTFLEWYGKALARGLDREVAKRVSVEKTLQQWYGLLRSDSF